MMFVGGEGKVEFLNTFPQPGKVWQVNGRLGHVMFCFQLSQ